MKRLFFVFAVAAFVLFMVNPTLADDNIPTAIRGIGDIRPLTDEEAQEITSEPMIPPNAKREVVEITIEELMLSPGVYWILGGEKKIQILCLEKTTFLNLPGGVYTIYTAPQKSSSATEIMKQKALRKM